MLAIEANEPCVFHLLFNLSLSLSLSHTHTHTLLFISTFPWFQSKCRYHCSSAVIEIDRYTMRYKPVFNQPVKLWWRVKIHHFPSKSFLELVLSFDTNFVFVARGSHSQITVMIYLAAACSFGKSTVSWNLFIRASKAA